MTRTQIATADFSCGGMQKGTNGDESDERLRTENSYINNRHKHTIIAILSVKKGSKFTDPDAQFPRGGALACARGYHESDRPPDFDSKYSSGESNQTHQLCCYYYRKLKLERSVIINCCTVAP